MAELSKEMQRVTLHLKQSVQAFDEQNKKNDQFEKDIHSLKMRANGLEYNMEKTSTQVADLTAL